MTDKDAAESSKPKAYLIDMDGVLIRGNQAIPGASEFLERLRAAGAPFMVLTNNSRLTPHDHHAALAALGLNVSAECIFTSALATSHFLDNQRPKGTAFVIGEAGRTTALHDIGYRITEHDPDYVVLGETNTYSFVSITTAIRLIQGGARFIATNPDVVGPTDQGIVPATGAVAALITAATGVQPYFVGKPNPLMMREALREMNVHSENAIMIGDRMDTDMVAGIESGLETILVLSGVTTREEVDRYPYRPHRIVNSVADIYP
ncbi:MAG: HAD family hydrolase [Chloroflexi bacterium]|nr:HAD family hydrolase [Chloroflexota bacterium]